MITHDTPNSSNIARLNYNSEKGHLEIEFRAGKTYRYYGVDYDTWNSMVDSASIGQFFNSQIRGKFKEERI